MNLSQRQIEEIISLVQKANQKILEIYNFSKIDISIKEDNSPITKADKVSHDLLTTELKKLYPDIPILSEEGEDISYQERKNWEYFWLIDPLDGTKEFILKNGEFTVNIALIHKNSPVFGIVSIPVKEWIYFSQKSKGAFKINKDKKAKKIQARNNPKGKIIVVRSRSHSDKKEQNIIEHLGGHEVVYAGSSIKFCYVAEGLADIYIRTGSTMEWDTGAGQCITECAGAKTFTLDGKPFLYNKQSLLNSGLVCTANNEISNKLNISL